MTVTGGVTTRDVAERFGLQWQPLTIYNQYELVGNQLRRRHAAGRRNVPRVPEQRDPRRDARPARAGTDEVPAGPGRLLPRHRRQPPQLRGRELHQKPRAALHGARRPPPHQRTTASPAATRRCPIRGDRGRSGFQVGRDEVNTGGTDYSWSRQLLFTDTHIFSPSVVNELRLNYTYGRFTRNFPPGFDAYTGRNLSTELGLPSLTPGGLPEFITGGGNIGWSQSQQNENAEHTFNAREHAVVGARAADLEVRRRLPAAAAEDDPDVRRLGRPLRVQPQHDAHQQRADATAPAAPRSRSSCSASTTWRRCATR